MRTPVKTLALSIAAALCVTSAQAATYYYDFTVGTNHGSNGRYYDYDTNSYGNGDIQITGYVETDGTIGTINSSNILSWEFTLTGEHSAHTMSSLDEYTFVNGSFDATTTSLSNRGSYTYFYSYDSVYSATNTLLERTYGRIQNYEYSNYGYDYGYFIEYDYTAGRFASDDGEYAYSYYNFNSTGGQTNMVGTSIAPVPLPAAMPLMLIGLGGLVALRRRA